MGFQTQTEKIDNKAVEGLLGVVNSLAYRVHELERHMHNRDVWFGIATTPSGETHAADIVGGGIDPFELTTGNDDFGAWVLILGSSDTPTFGGSAAYFDSDKFIVTSTSSTNSFVLQVATGESSGLAAKITAGQYSTAMYISGSNLNDSGVGQYRTVRVAAGEKVWARACCIGANAQTITFYTAIHEYEG